jgi:adenine-specific DNA-methyltransferase
VTDRLYRGDCLAILPTLPAASCQLILTSPPYNCGWDYAGRGNDRRPLGDYLADLGRFAELCAVALRPGGVLCVNLPQTIRPDPAAHPSRSFPLAGWMQARLWESGWLLREPIVWIKGKGEVAVRATSTAIGAYSNPYLRPCHELVLVASRGEYRIPGRDGRWPGDAGAFGSYLELCKDVWALKPGRAAAGEPLAFPPELVDRLVWLFSNPGDVVLDPFAGTGTVGRRARLLGREAWLIEREPAYWPRLEAVLGQGVLVAVS